MTLSHCRPAIAMEWRLYGDKHMLSAFTAAPSSEETHNMKKLTQTTHISTVPGSKLTHEEYSSIHAFLPLFVASLGGEDDGPGN